MQNNVISLCKTIFIFKTYFWEAEHFTLKNKNFIVSWNLRKNTQEYSCYKYSRIQ